MRLRRSLLEGAAQRRASRDPPLAAGGRTIWRFAMFDELCATEQEPEEEQEQEQQGDVPELDEYSDEELDDLFDRLEGK
jgi:hypothetical protein